MTDYKGLIFPLYSEIIKRAVEEDRDVFAKFSRRQAEPGTELYLYATGEEGERKIIAKADITTSKNAKPSEVRDEYGDRLMQTEEEFDDYVRGRSGKEMLVLELDNLELLDEPVTPPGNMTVAGLYLNEERYSELKSNLD
ncbi:MAG: hypothetical protein ABEJ83_04295 [Candidatus Nanohaloarchaea archaeon]